MSRLFQSFKYAIKGLKTVWKEEFNFRIEIFIAFLVLLFIYHFNFSFVESAVIIFAVVFVLVLEIINTIVEDICNKIEPKPDLDIAKIKDMSASFVLIGSAGMVLVGVFVLLNHFF